LPVTLLLVGDTGHGDFAQYHERFGHVDSKNYCSCGERKISRHFFFCGRLRKYKILPTQTPRAVFATLLREDSAEWARFKEKTSFFTWI
jgi:hypothetical protein